MDEPRSVREIWQPLGLPGVIDVHTHFMPKRVMDKVWQYFDAAGPLVGRPWPVTYRTDEAERLATLRSFGVRAFTSLVYPHKPQMAEWLNQWAAQFAAATPDCLATATFYPEPGAAEYVTAAIDRGTKVFKAHVQVGGYDPTDPLLDEVWGIIADARVPVVTHCGSGPQPGEHTGPEPIRTLLARHPRLRLVVAHMGMPNTATSSTSATNTPACDWTRRWPSRRSSSSRCRFHRPTGTGSATWATASCSAATSPIFPTATSRQCGY